MKAEYKAVLENALEDLSKRLWRALEIAVKDTANPLDDAALLALRPVIEPILQAQLDKLDGQVGDAVSAAVDAAPVDPAPADASGAV